MRRRTFTLKAASIAKKVKDGETAIFQSFITEEIAEDHRGF